MSKKVIIIAGPNGAGKTTFAQTFLPEMQSPRFINADMIAAILSPAAPEAAAVGAGRRMIEEIRSAVHRGENIAIETTLSGRKYLKHIQTWQGFGYHVTLIFLRLPDATAAVARVATRVQQGGHNIPEEVIRRRFKKGLENLSDYKAAVDAWAEYDNSGETPVQIDWSERP